MSADHVAWLKDLIADGKEEGVYVQLTPGSVAALRAGIAALEREQTATMPIEQVDAEIRAHGGDPECIAKDGKALVDSLLPPTPPSGDLVAVLDVEAAYGAALGRMSQHADDDCVCGGGTGTDPIPCEPCRLYHEGRKGADVLLDQIRTLPRHRSLAQAGEALERAGATAVVTGAYTVKDGKALRIAETCHDTLAAAIAALCEQCAETTEGEQR